MHMYYRGVNGKLQLHMCICIDAIVYRWLSRCNAALLQVVLTNDMYSYNSELESGCICCCTQFCMKINCLNLRIFLFVGICLLPFTLL